MMLLHTRLCDWCFGHFTSSKSPPPLQHFGKVFFFLHLVSGQSVRPCCAPLQSKTEIGDTLSQRPQWSRIEWFILLSEETNRTGFQNMVWETCIDEPRCTWGLYSSGMRHNVTECSVPCCSKFHGHLIFMGRCPVKNSFIEFFILKKIKTIVSKVLVIKIAKHCDVRVSHPILHS
jgi:hypothetical protein